jgi:hypothetical protein
MWWCLLSFYIGMWIATPKGHTIFYVGPDREKYHKSVFGILLRK